jgi:hypothetical protein
VQSPITGGEQAPPLTETGAVALVPAGGPVGAGDVRVALEDPPTLPLLLLWPAGLPSPAVHRLRAAMATGR